MLFLTSMFGRFHWSSVRAWKSFLIKGSISFIWYRPNWFSLVSFVSGIFLGICPFYLKFPMYFHKAFNNIFISFLISIYRTCSDAFSVLIMATCAFFCLSLVALSEVYWIYCWLRRANTWLLIVFYCIFVF